MEKWTNNDTIEDIARKGGKTIEQTTKILEKLVKKGLIEILSSNKKGG